MNFHCTASDNIVFLDREATSSFWDDLWNDGDEWIEQFTKSISPRSRFVRLFRRYLPRGSRILEGGCGRGQFVYALSQCGYDVLGIDFARKTVDALNESLPQLHVKYGDVRNLNDIADDSYDGYYSGGVIEHFWDGYDSIIDEAHRILKTGGYLFITFPFMSAARKRIKHSLPKWTDCIPPPDFYQFALDADKVIEDIRVRGFRLVHRKSRNGIKGFTDIYPNIPVVSSLGRNCHRKSLVFKAAERLVSNCLALLGYGHSIEVVFVKELKTISHLQRDVATLKSKSSIADSMAGVP